MLGPEHLYVLFPPFLGRIIGDTQFLELIPQVIGRFPITLLCKMGNVGILHDLLLKILRFMTHFGGQDQLTDLFGIGFVITIFL